MSLIRVADYIMSALSLAGVRHVFQVTGRGSLFLSDALAKSTDLQSISLHHEQSCGFAAVSYAECTDSIGACLVSTGCAATNAITPVLSAWQDGVPTVFISGQNILNETTNYTGLSLRTYGQQEANIVQIIRPITKYSHMLTNPSDIYEVVQKALTSALYGRKGPVWLDIPLDLQSSLVEADCLNDLSFNHSEALIPSSQAVDHLIELLSESERPVILVGKGIRFSNTETFLAQFVELHNIPVVYSSSAPDIYGSKNRLSIGSVGSMGCSRAGNFAVANSDLLIVLGSRLTPLTTGTDFCKFAREAKKVVVDIDPTEHDKPGINIDLFIHCDLAHFFPRFRHHLPKSYQSWVDKCVHWKSIFSIPEPEFTSNSCVDLYELS